MTAIILKKVSGSRNHVQTTFHYIHPYLDFHIFNSDDIYFPENPRQKVKERMSDSDQPIMIRRRSRIKKVCEEYGHKVRVVHSSLYDRNKPVNSLRGTFFQVGTAVQCVRGGSSSWEVFFQQNKIARVVAGDCEDTPLYVGTCPTKVDLTILQVRHPLVK